jgi:F0F1-type ATP synthase membrane subunit b/b'
VPISDTEIETSIYFQDVCRPLGQGMDATSLNCETQIDNFIKRKIYLRINRTDSDSSILNITVYNSDLGINEVIKNCPNFAPTLNVYLDYNRQPWTIGRNSMSMSILKDKKPDVSQKEFVYTVPLTELAAKLPRYCQLTFLEDTKSVYACQIWAVMGPGSQKTSIDYFYKLNVLNSSSAARRNLVDAQVINMNYTKPYYDSIFKSDANLRLKVFSYNKSDENMTSENYDNRFVINTFGRFEKNQIVRYVFELVNLTMTQRYSIVDWKTTAVISDSVGNQPYVGDTCNATFYNATTFYQSLVVDCQYSLKSNISLTFDVTLRKRDSKVFPETITISQVFMFEAYQNREKIVLAGLGKTATIIVIVIILLIMTSAICYLAIKAGAGEHFEEVAKQVKEGVTKGVEKAKETYKKTKKTIKETINEEKRKTKEMRQPLLDDDEEDSREKKKKKKDNSKEMKAKKRKNESEDDDDYIVPESLKKNDISAIKPIKDKRNDSQEDLLFDDQKIKKKVTKVVLDSDEEEPEPPQKYVTSKKVSVSKPITPIIDPKSKSNVDEFKFDSNEKNDDSSEEEMRRKPKKKAK